VSVVACRESLPFVFLSAMKCEGCILAIKFLVLGSGCISYLTRFARGSREKNLGCLGLSLQLVLYVRWPSCI
jgi:hypothetical protein